MSVTPMVRPYRSDLREEQTAATRERILDAAHLLLGTVRPVDLAMADVAASAGVATRTVYRHFPQADDLFLALSDRLLGRLLGPTAQVPSDLRGALEVLRSQFLEMERDPALYRVFFAIPTRSRSGGASAFEALFGARMTHLPPARAKLVYALMDLVCSPYAWDVLHANWGADADEAFRAAAVGVRAVLELLERDPAAFDHPFRLETP